jgi:hypothetical protein
MAFLLKTMGIALGLAMGVLTEAKMAGIQSPVGTEAVGGLVNGYKSFIFRPPPSAVLSPSVAESRDDVVGRVLLSCAFFMSLFFISPKLLKSVYQNPSISSQVKNELPAYLSSLLHHSLAVPYSLWRIMVDARLSPEEYAVRNYSSLESDIIPFSFGYLLCDTAFYALGAAQRGNCETLVHHILAMGLFYLSYVCPGHILRFVPHVIICESSAIFFNLAWLLRNIFHQRGSVVCRICEYLFAALFFVTRVVNLPMVAWAGLDMAGDMLMLGRVLWYPIISMQYYWFAKIVMSLFKRRHSSATASKGE